MSETDQVFTTEFYEVAERPAVSPADGITMRGIVGGKLMANWVQLEPHAVMPEHEHPHEQLSIVLEGSMEITIGDETRQVYAGISYTIPGGVAHRGVASAQGCLVVDIFTPPREDYLHFAGKPS